MVPLIRHAFRQQVARRRRAVGGTTCPFRWAVRHLAAGQHERWPAPGASDSAGVGVCAEDALVNPSSCEAYSHRPARGTPGACTDRPHRHRRVQEGGRPGAIGCRRYAGGLGAFEAAAGQTSGGAAVQVSGCESATCTCSAQRALACRPRLRAVMEPSAQRHCRAAGGTVRTPWTTDSALASGCSGSSESDAEGGWMNM